MKTKNFYCLLKLFFPKWFKRDPNSRGMQRDCVQTKFEAVRLYTVCDLLRLVCPQPKIGLQPASCITLLSKLHMVEYGIFIKYASKISIRDL